MPDSTPSFFSRISLAFKVAFDGPFAARVAGLTAPSLPAPEAPAPAPIEKPAPTAALQLLGLLQREGRLVDFLEQDVIGESDADIGAAARVVHEGCRKALRGHVTVEPIRAEEEGARVVLEAGFDPDRIKLVGNVSGHAPFEGTLRHKGWRAKSIALPEVTAGHDPSVLAPAEVEL